jgi:O-antigen ligase
MLAANRHNFVAHKNTRPNLEGIFFRLQFHRAVLLRLGAVCAVLALAPLVGALATIIGPVLIFIAIFAPLCLVGLNQLQSHLDLAPLIILFTAAFVPFGLSTGTQSRLVISLVMTTLFIGIWVFRMLFVEKRLWVHPSPVNRLLFGFVIITLISLPWSIVFRDPMVVVWQGFNLVQIASTFVMVMLPGAFLLVANQFSSSKQLKAMVAIMLIGGAIAVAARYASLGVIPVHDGGLFSMWIIALSVGLAFFNRQTPWWKRAPLLILAGSWVIWGFVLHVSWLAGWLPGMIAIGFLVFMRSKKLLIVLLVALAVLVALKSDYYLGTVIGNESNESGNTRLEAWQINWEVTGKHLLFGTGPAGYAAYYMSYFPDSAMASHSNYVDVIAQTGIIGLIFCIGFFFRLTWLGYKLCLRLKGRGNFEEALANAALAGTISCIVAMGFGDWLFPFAYTQTIAGFDYVVYSWLFMGAIPVLDRLTATAPAAAQTEDRNESSIT